MNCLLRPKYKEVSKHKYYDWGWQENEDRYTEKGWGFETFARPVLYTMYMIFKLWGL